MLRMSIQYSSGILLKWTLFALALTSGLVSSGISYSGERLIRFGIPVTDYPPYVMRQGNGLSGIVGDVFAAITKSLGYEFELVVLPEKRLDYSAKKGELDAIPTALEWENDTTGYLWTAGIITVSDSVVMTKDRQVNITAADDLNGMSAVLMLGFTYPSFETMAKSGAIRTSRVQNFDSLLHMVDRNRVDFGIIDQNVADWVIRDQNLKFAQGLHFSVSKFDAVDMRIVLYPTKDWTQFVNEFNAALAKFKASSAWEDILTKYR